MTTASTATAPLVFDTLRVFNILTEAGFSKPQAEAIAAITREAKVDLSAAATKADTLDIKDEIVELKLALRDQTNQMLMWFIGSVFAQVAAIAAILQLMR